MTVVARAEGVRGEHVVVPMPAGFEAADAARLSFDNGASRLDLRAGAADGRLLDARFAGPLPLVWAVDAAAHVEYPLGARLLHRPRPSRLRLAAGLPWSVDVHGGADRLDADLSGVDLRSLAFHAGLAHARIVLGRPRGRCTVRLASVDDLRISRPAGVPVRFEAAGRPA